MKKQKITWEKPQLIVLSRGTSEESVLTHCKRIAPITDGPESTSQDGCDKIVGKNCGACQARASS